MSEHLTRCEGIRRYDVWHSPVYFYRYTCPVCEALRQRNLLETQLYQLRYALIQHERGTPPVKGLLKL